MPKPRAWISGAASLALAVSWHAPLNAAITLHGIVLDRGTKVPVSNAIVTCVGDRAKHQDITDTYGLFTLELRDEVQAAQEITFRIEKEGYEASTQKESANGIVQIKLFITPTKRADSPAARPSTPRPNAAVHRSVPAPPPKARTPMLPDAPPEVLNFIQELRSEDPSARENA
ncbi:MAG: hypothetical protein M3Y27_08135, partial [Acidobacteriota bacterium]|nr:hypothetical protein [Acidobacteriota bacterium]